MFKLSNAEREILKELWKLIQSGSTLPLAQDDETLSRLPSLPPDAPPDDWNPAKSLDDSRRN